MAIITLTTEWRAFDYYVGAVKGTIVTRAKDATIIDISHKVQKYNVAQAAFTLKNCYDNFPAGTIHLVAVRSEASIDNPYIALYHKGHYFVGTDNGIFGLIFDEKPEHITCIDIKGENRVAGIEESSFPELTVLTMAACHLANGGAIEELGVEAEKLYRTVPMLPTIEEAVITGSVVYIDSYRNAISNITRELFFSVGKNRPFDIFVQNNFYKINRINRFYGETSEGEILAIFNSLGLLEIAIKNGDAAELLNLDTKSNIRVKFYDY